MAKKIVIGSGGMDFKQAAKFVENYKNDISKKCERLCAELCKYGVTIARARIGGSGFGRHIHLSSEITPRQAGCKAVLYMEDTDKIISEWRTLDGVRTAEVSPTLMVEFGSGLKAQNPAGIPGVGTGTFPGATHSSDPGGWYYMDLEGQWHHSDGITARMPMYFAGKEMRKEIVRLATDIFTS